MKKCYCDTCRLCPPLPANCRLREESGGKLFKLIEFAERTKDELDESLKWGSNEE